MQHPAKDRLVESILVSLFCCQPLGIVAIVFSALTMSANNSGDFDQAHRHAKTAGTFLSWGFGLGLVYIIGVAFFAMIIALAQ